MPQMQWGEQPLLSGHSWILYSGRVNEQCLSQEVLAFLTLSQGNTAPGLESYLVNLGYVSLGLAYTKFSKLLPRGSSQLSIRVLEFR